MEANMAKYLKKNLFLLLIVFSVLSCKVAYGQNTITPDTKGDAKSVTSSTSTGMIDLQEKLHMIANNESPSVVFIGTEKTVTQQNVDPFNYFFGNPFNQNPRNNQNPNQNQRQFKQTALGSGVIYRKTGNSYYIVTNNHVVDGADKIKVTIGETKSYDAKLLGSDADVDIAIIKIDTGDNLKVSRFGNSDNIGVGDIVIAIGNPFGFSNSMTMGIISAIGRSDVNAGDKPSLTNFIQTDAAINPGNSGGSLMNINGEVIGINTLIYSNQSGGNVGIGFAIPINIVKKVADQVIDQGKKTIDHGYLGVYFQELTEDSAKTLELKNITSGMMVAQIIEGSPAEKAGLKAGDVLIELNGKQLKKSSDLTMTVGNAAPGAKLIFKVLRDGQTMNIDVTLGNRNEMAKNDQQTMTTTDEYGLQVSDLNTAAKNQFKIPASVTGVIVTSVDQGGTAGAAGFQPGDVIFKVNSKKITKMDEYLKALNKDKENYFFIYRQGKELIIKM
jgi:serine protease Do